MFLAFFYFSSNSSLRFIWSAGFVAYYAHVTTKYCRLIFIDVNHVLKKFVLMQI